MPFEAHFDRHMRPHCEAPWQIILQIICEANDAQQNDLVNNIALRAILYWPRGLRPLGLRVIIFAAQ